MFTCINFYLTIWLEDSNLYLLILIIKISPLQRWLWRLFAFSIWKITVSSLFNWPGESAANAPRESFDSWYLHLFSLIFLNNQLLMKENLKIKSLSLMPACGNYIPTCVHIYIETFEGISAYVEMWLKFNVQDKLHII